MKHKITLTLLLLANILLAQDEQKKHSLTLQQAIEHALKNNYSAINATKDIQANTDLGISHVYDERFPDNYIRLSLGAFINHHEMPNCKAVVSESHESIGNIKHIRIQAEKNILAGEELTLNYIINKLDNPLWEFEYEVSQ